jgi:PLP dependent protein
LLPVSKRHPLEKLQPLIQYGVNQFAENQVQEALIKIQATENFNLAWHFIGAIQSNKTHQIAQHFSWVHSVDRLKIAERLSNQRTVEQPPLNVCLQVNISQEPQKSGVLLSELPDLAQSITALPNLKLRGLMCIPAPSQSFEMQRRPFARMREALAQLNNLGLQLDTLSMGMTQDFEAAIAEGATLIRIGTALFGPRSLT